MLTVFIKILIIFVMIGIGYVCNRTKILPDESNEYLVNLLLIITSPCMLIASITSNKLTANTLTTTVQVMVGTLLFFFVAWVVSFLLLKIMRYEPKADRGVMMVIMCSVNSGFMGFPITKAIFGNEFLYYMSVSNIVFQFYCFFLAVIQMNYGSSHKIDIKGVFRYLSNPCMIAAILGMVLLFGGIKLPWYLMDLVDMIGDATIPISMIVVGVQLGGSDLRRMIRNGKLLLASLVNVALMPVMTFFIVEALPFLTWQTKLTLTFMTCFPCAVVVVAIAAKEQKNATLLAEGVALSTMLSLITIPIAALFLTSYYLG